LKPRQVDLSTRGVSNQLSPIAGANIASKFMALGVIAEEVITAHLAWVVVRVHSGHVF